MSAVTQLKRKAAKRPVPRTVEVHGSGEYGEWTATARVDFPARMLADLQSGSISAIIAVLDRIVIDHNFPDSDGEIAQGMGDVDPYDGLLKVAEGIFDAIGKLPSR